MGFCVDDITIGVGLGSGFSGQLHLVRSFNYKRELCAYLMEKLGKNPHLWSPWLVCGLQVMI